MSTIVEKHTSEQISNLRMYVNDMLALEADITKAVHGQTEDERVKEEPGIRELLKDIAETSARRKYSLEQLSKQLEGRFGAMMKEAVMATAGTLAGLYGMVRKHPVSRMLRDDHVALNLAATAYGMLYTTAVTYDDDQIAEIALEHLNELPRQIMKLTRAIPSVVVKELTGGEPASLEAESLANEAIETAWTDAEQSVSRPL